VFKHSLIPFDAYYTKVRTVHFAFSFTYFWGMIALFIAFSVLFKAILFMGLYPPSSLKEAVKQIESAYPEELVVTIHPLGRLSTNIDHPFILFSPLEHNPRPLVVIDPKGQKEKMLEYDALILFTERTTYIRYGGVTYDYRYPTGKTIMLTKEKVGDISLSAQKLLRSYWSFILAAISFAILLGIPTFGISYFITLTIAAAIYHIVLSFFVKHKRLTFSSVEKIALHAATGPVVIQALAFVLGLSPSVPFWYTVLLYIFIGGALYEAYFQKS